MSRRREPDLERVREAMREHDAHRDEPAEEPPDDDAREDDTPEREDND
jgi:hypothetical protein